MYSHSPRKGSFCTRKFFASVSTRTKFVLLRKFLNKNFFFRFVTKWQRLRKEKKFRLVLFQIFLTTVFIYVTRLPQHTTRTIILLRHDYCVRKISIGNRTRLEQFRNNNKHCSEHETSRQFFFFGSILGRLFASLLFVPGSMERTTMSTSCKNV